MIENSEPSGSEVTTTHREETVGDNESVLKKERIEKEKQEVLQRAVSGQISDIRDRVAYILNSSTEARNSDIDLLWLYWETFEKEKLSGTSVSKDEMKNLARISSLSRMRAKIQNEYKLFQADNAVKKYRGKLDDEKRAEAIDDKPSGLGLYSVYIDESGKTGNYISVGSLWSLKFNLLATYNANLEIRKWIESKKIDFEFHFKDLSKPRLSLYKEFFLKFLTLYPQTSFKVIVLNNRGLADKFKAITDLTYHLISKGIEHEDTTGRAPLPRMLQVLLDEDEKGSDQLKIENIKERLKGQKIKGLYLDSFQALSSEKNFEIQIVDLFTASINRKLHSQSDNHYKDEFANFVLSALKFDITKINMLNVDIDNAVLFNLADFDPTDQPSS